VFGHFENCFLYFILQLEIKKKKIKIKNYTTININSMDNSEKNKKNTENIEERNYQGYTNPLDTGVYRKHAVPEDPPIPETSKSDNRHPNVQKEKPERYGFYIPPSIGKSQIIRNIPRPVYVDALTTPNPPSFRKEAVPSAGEVRGFIATQSFESEPQKTPITKLRSFRKTMSSNGKVGSANSFVVDLASNIRNVRKIRLCSLVLSYVVPATIPLVGYVYLRDFPLAGKSSYNETADVGQRYTAMFPILSGTVAATVPFAYAWPYCCYEMDLYKSDHTITQINVDVLKEDPVTIPGDIIPFTELTQFILELEFFVDDTVF
jgi:hypothetical protein